MEVVLLLVAMIAVVLAWGPLKEKIAQRANQAVFARQQHQHGQELVGTFLRATAVATPLTVRDALTSLVETLDNPPAIIQDLYVESERPDQFVYACGNRLTTNFRAVLTIVTDGEKVVVEQRFTDWTTADGVVSPVSTMQRLRADVARAVRAVDPRARVEILPRNHRDTSLEAP